MVLLNTLAMVLTAGIAWGVTEFVARPLRKFFDLRGEVIENIIKYANVRAKYEEGQNGNIIDIHDLSVEEEKRLGEATTTFRELASRMHAFAQNEYFATRLIRMYYNPLKASSGLIGLSNRYDTHGTDRHSNRKCVMDALRLQDTDAPDE